MADDSSNDYGRTDNPTEEMMRLQKKAEEVYGKITQVQLEDQQIKAIAQVKAGRAGGNSINGANFLSDRVDIGDLFDESIAKVSEGVGLDKLEPYDRYYYLYVWQGLLRAEKAKLKLTRSEYEVGRRETVKARLEEIEALLDDGDLAKPVPDAKNKEPEGSSGKHGPKERTYTTWMREVWHKAGQPKGNGLFAALKPYVDQADNPIVGWYSMSSNGSGVKLVMEDGTEKHYSKSLVQRLASKFAAEERLKNLSNSICK